MCVYIVIFNSRVYKCTLQFAQGGGFTHIQSVVNLGVKFEVLQSPNSGFSSTVV